MCDRLCVSLLNNAMLYEKVYIHIYMKIYGNEESFTYASKPTMSTFILIE